MKKWARVCGKLANSARSNTNYAHPTLATFGRLSLISLQKALGTHAQGLSTSEAAQRLAKYPPSGLNFGARHPGFHVLWNQVKSPLLLVLLLGALVATLTKDWSDATIVLLILICSIALGFWREYDAYLALEQLRRPARANLGRSFRKNR